MRKLLPLKLKKKIASFWKGEQGTIIVLVAISMSAMIALIGLVTDLGMLYVEKSNLKKEATTAVLSASQELTNSEARVNEVMTQVLDSYNDADTLESMQIDMKKHVSVKLKKYAPFYFMRLFGLEGITVEEGAGAELQTIGKLSGVTPLGIDESIQLTYGQETTLKVGAGDSTTGNFGIIAVDGNGASSYIDTLEYGSTIPVSVGDVFNLKSGNVAGDTRTGVEYRINNSPYPEGETFHRDDSRIIPIIVYKSLDSKQIEVRGFAYFYLLQPGDDTTVIRGKFIQRVDKGTFGSGSLDRGAYTAKLVE